MEKNPGLALIGLLGTGRFLVRPARPKNVYANWSLLIQMY